jgi:uncharacterized membrane protein YeaQ/YmgE (transglycosylase-associated protein family)
MLGTILFWIVFGFIIGFLANLIDPNRDAPGGWIGNIVLGIVGSVVGGWIGSALNLPGAGQAGFNFWSIVISVIGALIVLFLYRLVRGKSST